MGDPDDTGVPSLFDDPTWPATDDDAATGRPPFIEVRGTLFRVADYDTPSWSRPNTRSGRWHEADGETSAQYWSYQPETAWAEKLRTEGIRDPEDILEIRSRIWAGQIEFTEIADLTTSEWQACLDLDPAAMVADDHTPCRQAARRARDMGAQGIVVPSAAMPERLNLVLFKRLSVGDWYEQPTGQPAALKHPELLIAARLVAWGHPDERLTHHVVYRYTD